MTHFMSDKDAIKGMEVLRQQTEIMQTISIIKKEANEAIKSRIKNFHHCHFDYNHARYSYNRKQLWDIPFTMKYYKVMDGTEIVCGSFESLLKCIVFPDSLVSILSSSFRDCHNLSYVSFGKGLKLIGDYAFANCALKTVILPEGILAIGKEAFSNNTSLELIYLPESLQEIEANAFKGCNNLTICLPKNCKSRILKMLSGRYGLIDIGYNTWEEDSFAQEKRFRSNWNNTWDNDKVSDKDIFYGSTDGMYGDYPEEGFDDNGNYRGY